MPESRDPKEKKCAVCGKELYAGEEWAYKRRKTGQRTKWFCSYKCMREYDAKHDGKNAAVVTVDEVAAAPKEPTSRAVLAKALAKEIQRGGSVINYMKAEGYKNPWEAYNAVRHYAQTKMPELAEVLKPLKDLPKAPAAKTGRPRKYEAKVVTVDQVPEVEQPLGKWEMVQPEKQAEDPEPVQCIAHVTPAELAEAEEEKPKVDPKVAMEGLSKALSDFGNNVFTKERVLRILDEAALDCQKDQRIITMSSSGVKAAMLQNATVAAENVGIMKLRRRIREILGAEDDG